jgi:histidinol phosphatase-like PHP family hydrolase
LEQIGQACEARGYTHAAVTDHSHGLNIAGGMSMQEAAQQRHEIDRINASAGGRFRLLQGSSPASAPKARLISAPTEDALRIPSYARRTLRLAAW